MNTTSLLIIILIITKIRADSANDSLWVEFVYFNTNLINTFCFRVFKSLNVQNITSAPMLPTVAAASAPLASPTSKKT